MAAKISCGDRGPNLRGPVMETCMNKQSLAAYGDLGEMWEQVIYIDVLLLTVSTVVTLHPECALLQIRAKMLFV